MSTTTTPVVPHSSDLRHDPLEPVREALLAEARRDAELTESAAEQQARTASATAQAQADSIRAKARAQGEADAEQVRSEQRARARRRARARVLAAQREVLDDLRLAVHRELRRRWDDPVTRQALRARLADLAYAQVGEDAVIVDHPDAGIVATAGSSRAVFVLPDLADQVIDGLGPEIERMWER